jgi:hypothetical protein
MMTIKHSGKFRVLGMGDHGLIDTNFPKVPGPGTANSEVIDGPGAQ